MSIPDDIQQLTILLPEAGIEDEYVEKAIGYLLQDPSDQQRWGGVAVDYRNAAKFFAASIVFNAALLRFPESAMMWYSRGDLFRRWEKYECAEKSFSRALEIDPGFISPMFGLGLLYEQVEVYERAVEWYTKFLSNRPDSAAAHNNLANCLVRLDRRDAAGQHYQQAVRIDPRHEDALFSYAAFLYEDRSYDRALTLIDQLLYLQPGDAGARQLRAEILARPTQPQKILKQQLTQRALILRGSPSYGWGGPAGQAEMTQTQADRTYQQPLGISEMSNLTVEEIRSKFGYRIADVAQLQQLLDGAIRKSSVSAASEQKTIFISYRRSSEEHIGWVRQFASEIVTRGYQVVFDEFLVETHSGITVPELVSHLATCNLFVPILTNTYARSVDPDGMYSGGAVAIGIDEDAWVFDEMRMAKYLVGLGRTRFLGFWHSGFMLPSPFCAENVVDIRRDDLYVPALDRWFPILK